MEGWQLAGYCFLDEIFRTEILNYVEAAAAVSDRVLVEESEGAPLNLNTK